MKKIVLLLCLLSTSFQINAQKQSSSQDSIKVFYEALFSNLKEGFLYKDKIDWQTIEAETKENLSTYSNFKKSLNEVEPLFSKIDATHCAIYYENHKYSISAKIDAERYSEQWLKKYKSHPEFETKVIDKKFGYILMPALEFLDTGSRNVNKIAQGLYDEIAALKSKPNLEGYIIDLRFNTGGNSWPMLLALYDFLGDHKVSSTLDVDKKLLSSISLKNGHYLEDSKKQYRIKPNGKLLDTSKVAIITGVVTASSGEVVAMAFKGRPNTIFIGENTLGFTSANYAAALPFGALMIITKAYNSDRNANYYDQIVPDVHIAKQDNFDDLLLDGNIQEAIRFISEKE